MTAEAKHDIWLLIFIKSGGVGSFCSRTTHMVWTKSEDIFPVHKHKWIFAHIAHRMAPFN